MSADINKREDGINYYSFDRNYKTMQIPGHEIRNIFLYQGFYDKASCGEGEGIDEIFANAANFATNVLDSENYTFSEEAAFLKELLVAIKCYKFELDELREAVSRITEEWVSKVNPREMTKEQRQQEMNYVGHEEIVRKREEVTNRLEKYILNLMNGELSDAGMPSEKPDIQSLFDSVDLPIMTHMPKVGDIGKKELESSPLYQVLYNIVAKDVYAIVSLFHDYNNGNVCVRLWKKEGESYSPCFCSIKKTDVYMEHIGYGTERAFWPGLIKAAADQLEVPNDKRILAEAILGPELKNHDIDYIVGRNLPVAVYEPRDYDGPESEYARGLFETYIVLQSNGSLFVKDNKEYHIVKIAIRELIDALFSCFDGDLERALPSCEYLKEKIAEYEEYAKTATMAEGAVAKKRVAVLNTLSILLNFMSGDSPYKNNPREYFERNFTTKTAEHLLNSYHKDVTAESLKAMTEKLYSNKAYRSSINKLSMHMLNAAPQSLIDKMVKALIEKR